MHEASPEAKRPQVLLRPEDVRHWPSRMQEAGCFENAKLKVASVLQADVDHSELILKTLQCLTASILEVTVLGPQELVVAVNCCLL